MGEDYGVALPQHRANSYEDKIDDCNYDGDLDQADSQSYDDALPFSQPVLSIVSVEFD